MKKIVILGGSGFVGTNLTEKLLAKDYQVLILDIMPSRLTHQNLTFHKLNLMDEDIPTEIIINSHGIINLAGIPIFGRFTKKYKDLIYKSRILTTRNIVKAIMSLEVRPKVLVSASAIGYYGDQKDKLLNEEMPSGEDFLSHVCKDWETEALKLKDTGTRVVILRTAHVIGQGSLAKILKNLFTKNIGGYFGNGAQRMPWISSSDLVDMYIFALEENIKGIYNTASNSPTQKEFMNAFKERYKSLFTWSIPRFFGFLLYGEFIDTLLGGQNIDSTKIKNSAFVFKDTELKELLKNI
ncbi:MAG: TIGR01777 family oxidoreductase [Candidatus Paceibacterota bacterium]